MMKSYHYLLLLFCVYTCFTTTSIQAQKQGNIVEYFGKEKVNDIQEGELLHVFNKGLYVKQTRFINSTITFPKDLVFVRFLNNPNLRVQSGESFDVAYNGKELKWNEIKTDTTNTFNNRQLYSSYLYLEYNSNKKQIVLFEASGHTRAVINGLPHEGDHYDFGWSLIPIELKKGINTFVLKVGRFPRVRARLINPKRQAILTTRDLTMPDVLEGETKTYHGAIRVINASNQWLENSQIITNIGNNTTSSKVPVIAPLSVQKIPIGFKLNVPKGKNASLKIDLEHAQRVVDNKEISLAIKSKNKHHKRTFISAIDGSVQYFSVAPSLDKQKENQALFLSVHGASVEAVNQANAYKQKDWGTLVAPTNRRPFGFAWEDWGRLDAMEVLKEAKQIYQPNPQQIYLTGHSMGGHGTWYLGATYPDQFAAIAPCAGYPDLLSYRGNFIQSLLKRPKNQLTAMGIDDAMLERLQNPASKSPVENLLERAGTPSRTLKLKRNYLHHGIYILHGEIDNVVPTSIARGMRQTLGEFHNDFTYYEYPDGTHWYGDHSVDWPPIFELFKQRQIETNEDIKKLEFYTGAPGVSHKSHFISILQQTKAFEVSSFKMIRSKSTMEIETDNVELLAVDLEALKNPVNRITINHQEIKIIGQKKTFLKFNDNKWWVVNAPSSKEKGSHRNGGFKDAFNNNVVFIIPTKGDASTNAWYLNKARFDAQTFYYRANGNISLIKDTDFIPEDFPDQNIVVYGNADNNSTWKTLLNHSDIQVKNNQLNFGARQLNGNQWATYFIVPRTDSEFASVGVVSATGKSGQLAAYANHYMVNGTTFPDVTIFDQSVLQNGEPAIKCTGFFSNLWKIKGGEFEWK